MDVMEIVVGVSDTKKQGKLGKLLISEAQVAIEARIRLTGGSPTTNINPLLQKFEQRRANESNGVIDLLNNQLLLELKEV